MKCPYCGKEVVEGSKFCDGCGAKLDEVRNVDKSYEYVYEPQKKSKTGLIVAIIIISILVITGIVLGIVLLNNSSNNSNNNSNNNNSNKDSNEKQTQSENDKIKYSDYQLEDGKVVVFLENKNTSNVTVELKIGYYDEDDTEVDNDTETIISLAPGQETFVRFYNSERSYKKYKLKVETVNSYFASLYKNHYNDIKISSKDNKDDKEIEVKFSNNSSDEIDAKIAVVFYKNGKIVGYNYDYEYGIDANKTIAMYVDYPYDSSYNTVVFDDYKVFIVEAYSYAY